MLAAVAALAAATLGFVQAAQLLTTGSTERSIARRVDSGMLRVAATGSLPRDLTARPAAFEKAAKDLGSAPETVMRIEDRKVGDVPIRLYRPGEGLMPAIIYTHGGGFDKGGLDSHDAVLRLLANRCHCVIVAVGYRLAPEHKHPAQVDDAYAALGWAAANATSLEILPDQFVVAGDGVGGNLAAFVALRARDERGPKIIFQALFYPVTDLSFASESRKRMGGGRSLRADYDADVVRTRYLPDGMDGKNPRVSPLYANLRGLPPAFVALAELDSLRDDGRAFAARLQEAGVRAEAKVYAGQPHGFLLMTGKAKASWQLIDDIAARLRRAFGYVE